MPKPYKYDDCVIKLLHTLRQDNSLSWQDIANQVNDDLDVSLSAEGARMAYRNNPLPGTGESEIIYSDTQFPVEGNFDEIAAELDRVKEERKKYDYKQHQCHVTIKTKEPIALSFISDAHIGSPYTNYEALRKDIALIRDDPRFYVGLGGDIIDNFQPGFKDATAPMKQLTTTQIQLIALEALMKELDGKIVAAITGNHDTMEQRRTGRDSQYFIRRNQPFPNLLHGGLVNLTVGKITYKIIWKHKYRFTSSLNIFNSLRQMINMLEPDADMGVQEHEHNPGILSCEVGEYSSKKTQIQMRTGAYKADDDFSMDQFKEGCRGPQTVILWPDKKKKMALHGDCALEDAQTFLNGYRLRNAPQER